MTVHASKGLEFPVVAVSECFGIRKNSSRMQSARRADGTLDVVALPGRFPSGRTSTGEFIDGSEVEKRFKKFLSGSGAAAPWLDPSLMDDVCATGSAAEAWVAMRADEDRLALEERARLLYVTMTRAREVCLLALDAPVGRGKDGGLSLKPETDLTGAVLERILPDGGASLACDRLVFGNAQEGDFELITLQGFTYGGVAYEEAPEACGALAVAETCEAAGVPAASDAAQDAESDASRDADTFTLVEPAARGARIVAGSRAPRVSYSYSSISAALHATDEDRAHLDGEASLEGDVPATDTAAHEGPAAAPVASAGDPTALGSAFHAACQWLVELGCDELPDERAGALCCYWGCTPEQRVRFDAAMARWLGSDVRAEALAWPCVRAEVPFYTLGMDELAKEFGAFAEGAIDLLCTDPARPSRALLIDYKTGGSPLETPEQVHRKHELQARVYADVLHKAGYTDVVLKFVRVEVPDPVDPMQPQVVTYEL